MKRLAVFFLVVFAAAALAQAGRPVMQIASPIYDAGDIFRTSERLEHTFIVRNQGNAPLEIKSVKPG